MSELPQRWRAYADLQEKLALRRQVDYQTWGLEAGLNRLLVHSGESAMIEDADLAARSESRKERHRRKLRRLHLAVTDSVGHPEDVLDARHRLRMAEEQVTAEEWALLRAVGEGEQYAKIATVVKVSVGVIRTRVFRLRRSLVARTGQLARGIRVRLAAG
jgi:DNA-binding NarL/FixJ family response regulator